MSDLSWIAHSLLRGAGWGCMLRIEAHFDESGTDASEITLAGYLFEAARIDEFCELWTNVLCDYNLPYFHMVDCAHRNPPFDHLTITECTRVQMRLMGLIKRYSINGIVANISNLPDLNSEDRYKDAAIKACGSVVEWADRVSCSGKVAYFFLKLVRRVRVGLMDGFRT